MCGHDFLLVSVCGGNRTAADLDPLDADDALPGQ